MPRPSGPGARPHEAGGSATRSDSGSRVSFLKKYHPDLMLVGATLVWGATFAVVKSAVAQMPPFTFMTLRFGTAALVMLPIIIWRRRHLDRATLIASAVLGVWLYAMYAFQTVGVLYTTAGKSGFITGLFVAFVPVLNFALTRRLPSPSTIVGVTMAVMGLALLSLTSRFMLGLGDALTVLAAFFAAVHIIALSRYSPRHDVALLVGLQLAISVPLHTLGAVIWGRPLVPPPNAGVWGAIIGTALFASVLAFFAQTYAQKTVGPTRTAVILTAEPVFAGVFAYLLLGEMFNLRGWIGAALILSAMFVVEIYPALRRHQAGATTSPVDADALVE